jgi:hypothetical protein
MPNGLENVWPKIVFVWSRVETVSVVRVFGTTG